MTERRDLNRPNLSTLADVPTCVAYRIESVGMAVRDLGYYVTLGLRAGGLVRVLARWPETAPRFIEVEINDHLISLPLPLASDVRVSVC
jgi:hypothetical protein